MFNPGFLTDEDRELAESFFVKQRSRRPARERLYEPDVVIAPDGEPYLYRWHVIPRNDFGNVYLHVQVASDPERPLHDHPWDNQSVILSGGYDEIVWSRPPHGSTWLRHTQKGDVIQRRAHEAHRLILPRSIPYTMTLFTTGPVLGKWGFWCDGGWKPWDEVTEERDGQQVWKESKL